MVNSQITQEKRGQIIGALLTLVAFGVTAYAISLGLPWAGVALATDTVIIRVIYYLGEQPISYFNSKEDEKNTAEDSD